MYIRNIRIVEIEIIESEMLSVPRRIDLKLEFVRLYYSALSTFDACLSTALNRRVLERVKVKGQAASDYSGRHRTTPHVLMPEAASARRGRYLVATRRSPRDLQTGRRGWLRPLLSRGS